MACGLALAAACGAQISSSRPAHSSDEIYKDQAQVTFDTNEVLFTMIAALDSCDPHAVATPLRQAIRDELATQFRDVPAAATARRNLCAFVRDHSQHDEARDLAQYLSLGLYLQSAPEFNTRVPESDLPPDAAYVLGFVPEMQRFYRSAAIHELWEKHAPDYEQVLQEFRPAVAKLISDLDTYLRFPISGYLGRQLVLVVEPIAPPGLINARHYGNDYFLVLSPTGHSLKLDAVRHLYLHYLLEPLVDKKFAAIKRFEPILEDVSTAPMEQPFKDDIRLLVVESLIRAIEAREPGAPAPKDKAGLEARARARDEAVENATRDGYVLTHYFFDQLAVFERDENGLQDAFSNWIYNLDLSRQRKFAQAVKFHAAASPELVHASKPGRTASLNEEAEKRLSNGELQSASELANRALQQRSEDPARAMFILARVAVKNGDPQTAERWFERTLQVASEPRVVAWSHIYLGRMLDLQSQRDRALIHYRAALSAGDGTPDTKAAADAGIAQPYEPHPAQR